MPFAMVSRPTPFDEPVQVVEVVVTNITRRGNGTTDPIRIVRQVWTKDGQLIAEADPCANST